jgi:hypothetical protein
MNRIKCFWMDALPEVRYWLRAYETMKDAPCPLGSSYHNAMTHLKDGPIEYYEAHGHKLYNKVDEPEMPQRSAFPALCKCGHVFGPSAVRHVFHRQLFKRADTGEKLTTDDAPVGAMWNAWWEAEHRSGADGMSLTVKTPGGDWCIDARCSNCTKPNDRVHKCWIRHGAPPDITVDKNGVTCAAGAGSIVMPGYHGFLRNGYLEQC